VSQRLCADAPEIAHHVEEFTSNPPQVPAVLREIGESFLNFQVVAKREQEQQAELARLPDVVASVPFFETDIYDLTGLLSLGRQIWGEQ
jgi:hypothetical protein